MDADISGLVSAVYDAAGDSTAWAGTLDKLAISLSAATTSIVLYDRDATSCNLAVSIGLEPAEQHRYHRHYAALDTWGVHGGHLLEPGKVIYGEAMCTRQTVQRSEFYADFLRPNGKLLHLIAASVDRRGPHHSIVSLTRSASAGAFDSRAHRLLSQLMPHFQRALALQRSFAGLRATADWHADVVDRLPVGVAMISATGRVIELNGRARELLAKADGLIWERGYLAAQLSGESRALLALIRNAALTGEGKGTHPGGPISISRPSGRRAFKLLVCPYRPSPLWRGFEPPSATVLMTDPEQRITQSSERLIARYGLTFAEARLAMRLVQGESVSEAAAALGITAHTVRTHLKRVFAKTGTTRQPELVRQLLLDPESFTRSNC